MPNKQHENILAKHEPTLTVDSFQHQPDSVRDALPPKGRQKARLSCFVVTISHSRCRVCRQSLAELTSAYLKCMAASGAPSVLQLLDRCVSYPNRACSPHPWPNSALHRSEYPASTVQASIDRLQRTLVANDCLADAGVAWEGHRGFYWMFTNDPAGPLCIFTCVLYLACDM